MCSTVPREVKIARRITVPAIPASWAELVYDGPGLLNTFARVSTSRDGIVGSSDAPANTLSVSNWSRHIDELSCGRCLRYVSKASAALPKTSLLLILPASGLFVSNFPDESSLLRHAAARCE